MDGWIRSWFYETIDQANFRDDEHFLEIQPIYEYHISENSKVGNSMLMCIRKQEADNPESTFWYAQRLCLERTTVELVCNFRGPLDFIVSKM
ncbi:hypothetical protein DMN91_008418 [Ooceraea biroi]|uniref:Uncharacterized protein n=1 Tax=Ooceraea biroi TaxID=2015173 RepID=A0A3L8DIV1_OOCBI|nr:hypothetical protein DMN91_008418 [Ooceraea biroi]